MQTRRPPLLQQIHRVARCPVTACDTELLGRYLREQDESAFADLVTRHGPMVLRVCRRVLGEGDAADEALQATFLVLARRAAAVHPAEALPAWLHGVASRVALKARSTALRRGQHAPRPLAHDPPDRRPGPLAEAGARELLTVLEEEVARLPESYRLAVLLCCFEGATQEEAARRLGWTPGSLQGRLERGRKRLHERLARRGFVLGVALTAVESSRALAAPVRGACLDAVLAAASSVAAGQPLSPEFVSARVIGLAEGVLNAMFLTRIKSVLGVLLVAATLMAGGTALLPYQSAVAARQDRPPLRPQAPARKTEKARRPKVDRNWKEELVIRPHGPMGDQLYCAAFSPDGKMIACGLSHNGKLLDATNGKETAVLDVNHPMCLAFSPDGKTLATGHLSALILWDVETAKSTATLDPNTNNMSQVQFSPDGKFLVSAEVGTVRLWSMATKKEVRRFDTGEVNRVVYAAVFSPDGKRLATAEGPARTLKLWEVSTGKEIRTIKAAHTEYAVAVAWSPDGTVLASSGGEGLVKLWDVKTGKALAILTGPVTGKGHSLAFSPDGGLLASVGSKENALRLWEVATGKEVVTLKKHTEQIWSVAFSRDGKKIVTAGDDAVRVWVAEKRAAGKK
jgi:RNA polymerase sigma factor (sigma-70 family)